MKKIFFMIFCLTLLSTQSVVSQNLIWTSPSYTNGSVYSGWFVLKNNPLELRFYTFDYSSRELKIMDDPLSSTPLLDLTLGTYESFSSDLSYDYSGDGLNDLIIYISYPPPDARYGLRYIDVSNGQTLFTFDDASYTYGFETGLPPDLDGDGHTDIAIYRSDINNTEYEYLVYSTDGIPVSISPSEKDNLMKEFKLNQNYPNPFNPSTTIQYSVSSHGKISINIYDVSGQLVKEINDEHNQPGNYYVVWNGENNIGQRVSSGVYFYQLTAGKYVQAKKMILLK